MLKGGGVTKDSQTEFKLYSACGVLWEPELDYLNARFIMCDPLRLTHEVSTGLFSLGAWIFVISSEPVGSLALQMQLVQTAL